MVLEHAWPKWPKSAARIDGAMIALGAIVKVGRQQVQSERENAVLRLFLCVSLWWCFEKEKNREVCVGGGWMRERVCLVLFVGTERLFGVWKRVGGYTIGHATGSCGKLWTLNHESSFRWSFCWDLPTFWDILGSRITNN